jgi:hypothetical protein
MGCLFIIHTAPAWYGALNVRRKPVLPIGATPPIPERGMGLTPGVGVTVGVGITVGVTVGPGVTGRGYCAAAAVARYSTNPQTPTNALLHAGGGAVSGLLFISSSFRKLALLTRPRSRGMTGCKSDHVYL